MLLIYQSTRGQNFLKFQDVWNKMGKPKNGLLFKVLLSLISSQNELYYREHEYVVTDRYNSRFFLFDQYFLPTQGFFETDDLGVIIQKRIGKICNQYKYT